MAKSSNQKLKLLYLMKMLVEKTDEDNTMTIGRVRSLLTSYTLKLEYLYRTKQRKTLYLAR